MKEAHVIPLPDRLLERCRQGDDAAWTLLYRRHAGTVQRFLRRILGPQGDVEDLVQDVFAEMVRCLPGYRGDSALTSWIYGIASNVAHRHVGIEVRWRRRRVAWGVWMEARADEVPDGACGVDARRTLRALGEALGDLNLGDRAVWVLREWEGLDTEDVAEALEIPPGTVRSRLCRARRHVADALARRGLPVAQGPGEEGTG